MYSYVIYSKKYLSAKLLVITSMPKPPQRCPRSETCNVDIINSNTFRLDLTMAGQDCNTQSAVRKVTERPSSGLF